MDRHQAVHTVAAGSCMKRSVAATQWNVLKYLNDHHCGRAGRDVDGRIANGLVKRGLVKRSIGMGPRGGQNIWYELTRDGVIACERTLKPPHPTRPTPIQQAIIDLRAAIWNAIDAADEINESEVKLTKKQEKELTSLHGDVRMLVNKTAIASNDQGDWFDE